ncbi:MAG: glycoside hydrolase family 95 protein [Acidimicrobiales bacterium]
MTPEDQAPLLLWYDAPAADWFGALPLGNGRLGAMVHGTVPEEVIDLNLDDLWSGKRVAGDRPGAWRHLAPLREAVLAEEDYVRAGALAQELQGPFNESFQPLGSLRVAVDHGADVDGYRRELSLREALARAEYHSGGVRYTREAFVSAAGNVLALRLSSDGPRAQVVNVRLDSPHPGAARAEGNRLALRGRAPAHVLPHYLPSESPITYDPDTGLIFSAVVGVLCPHAGQIFATSAEVHARGADEIVIFLAARSGFRGYAQEPERHWEVLERECERRLEEAARRGYQELRAAHVRGHRQLFERVEIQLDDGVVPSSPTDQRLVALRVGKPDADLLALYAQYGRYLLISSSRPGGQPANLQGIWNLDVRPPWSCNFTTNINVQMNYWLAEVGNLPECHLPLIELARDLSEAGRATARAYYGCGGWVAHHNVDLWRSTWPVGEGSFPAVWANWPMGGVWLCQHLWEHYRFGGDSEFLAMTAYPVMRGAAEFVLDFLTEDRDGLLTTCPSTSPENSFVTADGRVEAVSAGATLDLSLVRDLFRHCIEAAVVLGVDAEFARRVAEALGRLTRLPIGPDGRLQEWWRPFQEEEPGHRHLSHLWGLYPGDQISLRRTPVWAAAAQRALAVRLENGGGARGWSTAWVAALAARLGDSELARDRLVQLMAQDASPNLFNGAPDLFQIDGNFGGAAALLEMLVQSQEPGVITLLPALPVAWPAGRVHGLCAREGIEVGIVWGSGRIETATLEPRSATRLLVRSPRGCLQEVRGPDGLACAPSPEGDGWVVSLELSAPYELRFGGSDKGENDPDGPRPR